MEHKKKSLKTKLKEAKERVRQWVLGVNVEWPEESVWRQELRFYGIRPKNNAPGSIERQGN